jgi:hypothetical protein
MELNSDEQSLSSNLFDMLSFDYLLQFAFEDISESCRVLR